MSVSIIGKYFVVQCGRLIKIAEFDIDDEEASQKLYNLDDSGETLNFTSLNLNFYRNIEIAKIWSVNFKEPDSLNTTSVRQAKQKCQDLIQIVAKDNE